MTEAVLDLSKKLGPIFKLKLGGINMVITVDPNHVKQLFYHEGKYPVRPPFSALLHYRRKVYGGVGVVPGNNEEWYKFRKGVSPLLSPEIFLSFQDDFTNVAKDFIHYIRRCRTSELVLEDVYSHLLKYAIEGRQVYYISLLIAHVCLLHFYLHYIAPHYTTLFLIRHFSNFLCFTLIYLCIILSQVHLLLL